MDGASDDERTTLLLCALDGRGRVRAHVRLPIFSSCPGMFVDSVMLKSLKYLHGVQIVKIQCCMTVR
jgi:hypothetical protein